MKGDGCSSFDLILYQLFLYVINNCAYQQDSLARWYEKTYTTQCVFLKVAFRLTSDL